MSGTIKPLLRTKDTTPENLKHDCSIDKKYWEGSENLEIQQYLEELNPGEGLQIVLPKYLQT